MSKKFAESVAPAQADKLLCSLMEDENDWKASQWFGLRFKFVQQEWLNGSACYSIFNWS